MREQRALERVAALVALRPRIAFIVDIRRQNMIHQLMYKALIEMAGDRADFMSMLFARRRPEGLDASSTADALFTAYGAVSMDTTLIAKNISAMRVASWTFSSRE